MREHPTTLILLRSISMNIYKPYTYLIGWSSHKKYYYGMRYATKKKCLYKTGCHPDELWVTYFTSSKEVAEYREKHGEPDIIEIRKTFNDALSAKIWENKVLKKLKVATSDNWLNKSYAMCNFNLHEYNTGRKRTNEQRRRMSNAQKGRKVTWGDKISKANKGKKPWNTGKKTNQKTTAKTWIITSPNGKVFKAFSLRQWCMDNNIHYQCLHRNIKNNKTYKGYSAKEL